MKLTTLLFGIAQAFTLCAAAAPNVYWDIPHYLNYTTVRAKIDVLEGKHTGYFYSTQYSFTGGKVNSAVYIGLQPRTNSTNHLTYSAFGEGVVKWDTNRCYNTADGGPGVSCSLDWPWEFNHTYYTEITLDSTNETDGSNTWVGSLYDEEAGTSLYIANFTTPADWGLLQGGVAAFDEYYGYTFDLLTPVQHCLYYTSAVVYPPIFTYSVDGVETNLTGPIFAINNVNDTSGNNSCSPDNESGQRGFYLPDNAFRWENGFRDNY